MKWISSDLPTLEDNLQSGHWLIFASSQDLTETLKQKLQFFSQTCTLVTLTDNTLEAEISSIHTLKSDFSAASLDTLWTQVQQINPISSVIWIEAQTESSTEITPSNLELQTLHRCQSALLLMQSLIRQSELSQTKLWIVTENGVALGSDLPALDQGAIWGLSRIFGLEHPEQWGGLIDFDRKTTIADRAQSIILEVLGNQTEEQVAYQGTTRSVARLISSNSNNHQPLSISSEGSYLISGGLGGVGISVAHWLAKQGASQLLLLSRGGANTPEKQAAIAQLESAGVTVLAPLVDVSDEKSLAVVLEDLPEEFLPLRGIVHVAGIEGGAYPIEEIEPSILEQTLRPKVRGTWNLHQLTLNWKLDFFVNFSSIAAVWGSSQQAHYGAANEFQNLFAQYRLAKGMPVLTINWSAIKGSGIINRFGNRTVDRLSQIGIESLSLQQMTSALELLLGNAEGQRVVAPVNWQQLDEVYQSRRSRRLLEELVQPNQNSSKPTVFVTKIESGDHYFEELLAATPEARKEEIAIYLQRNIAKVLGFKGDRVPAIEQNLLSLGMDSLMMMQVLSKLKQDLQLMIYPRELYDRPRIDNLAEYLDGEFAKMHAQGDSETDIKLTYSIVKEVGLEDIAQGNIASRELNQPQLPQAAFILSPPRSGSTLLRVMLAGHDDLFSPPELHLLPFASLREREQSLGATYLHEGLQKALMELMDIDAASSASLIENLEAKDFSIYQMYAFLQEKAGDRLLVDKSPTYALELDTLERAETIFQKAKYIHLTRHPYASMESFAKLRLDKLFGAQQNNPYRMAEEFWLKSHQNILNFSQKLEPERYHLVQYENLVRQPEQELKRMCKFLETPFVPELLQPYAGKRMVEGVHESSAPIGDPNFFNHSNIEASLAETWRQIQLPHLLTQETRKIASLLNYSLPREEMLLNQNIEANREEIEL